VINSIRSKFHCLYIVTCDSKQLQCCMVVILNM